MKDVDETMQTKRRSVTSFLETGEFEFGRLMEMVEEKMEAVEAAYKKSNLPSKPDDYIAEALLIQIRENFYG